MKLKHELKLNEIKIMKGKKKFNVTSNVKWSLSITYGRPSAVTNSRVRTNPVSRKPKAVK